MPTAMMGAWDGPTAKTEHVDDGIEQCDCSAMVQFTDGSQTEGLALPQVEGQPGHASPMDARQDSRCGLLQVRWRARLWAPDSLRHQVDTRCL